METVASQRREVRAKRGSVAAHLRELRNRLLRIVLYLTMAMTAAWYFFDPMFGFLMRPLRAPLANVEGVMAVRGLLEGFLVRFEIALLAGLIVALPLVSYELWAFVGPGLTRRERRVTRWLGPFSGVLFLGGVTMGYLITGPCVVWLLQCTPAGTRVFLTLHDTVRLVLKFYVAFGLSFELPVVLVLLSAFHIISSQVLMRRWREATVLIFIVAAIITPTWDPLTMTICALPMCVPLSRYRWAHPSHGTPTTEEYRSRRRVLFCLSSL